jgi:hypothetical protein
MREFSAGENLEGLIGDVPGAQRPIYDTTSQIQKFWFQRGCSVVCRAHLADSVSFPVPPRAPSVTSATEPSELDLKGVETEHQEQACLLWAEQLSNRPNRMNIAPRRTPASKNYLPRASSAKS